MAATLSVATIKAIEKLIDQVPVQTRFGPEQTPAERSQAIAGLAPDECKAMFGIITRMILDPHDLVRLEPRGCTLEFLMQAGATDLCCSRDWCLSVFRGSRGALYDFNGWPGDNEKGGAIYYSADGSVSVDVFRNRDEVLTSCHEALDDAVEDYAERRCSNAPPMLSWASWTASSDSELQTELKMRLT